MENTFSVSLKRSNLNLIDVEMNFISNYENPIVVLPVWTPGSYLIRDYSRHVQTFQATISGVSTPSAKISKNEWQITSKQGDQVSFTYSIYAFDMTVRTSYLDDRKVFIAPASIFMYLRDENSDTKNEQYSVSFEMDQGWQIFTSLKQTDSTYIAEDFDELIDSPMCGAVTELLEIKDYEYNKIPNKVVIIGDRGDTDIDKFTNDLIKIQDESVRIFGELPYDRYFWFLYIVGTGGGGLEHKYCNVSIINRWAFTNREDYNRLLSLESHEHFHVYNIKRIRPSQLGPFNYSSEVYTKLLWVAEGLTSFYDKISILRAGLIDTDEYFKFISTLIYNLDNIPGRKVYSLQQASFDAWIKLYKSNENTNNSSVSYYLKGAIMSLCLDIEIRSQTNWEKSLDNFFISMYNDYKMDRKGYHEDRIQYLLEKYTNTDLQLFFDKYIRGTDEIDYNYYLSFIGYELVPVLDKTAWTGLKLDDEMKVQFVYKDSPASDAAIYYNDQIISINDYRATKKSLDMILERATEGDTLEINLFRDDILISRSLMVEAPRAKKYGINSIDNVDDIILKRRESMFGPYNK